MSSTTNLKCANCGNPGLNRLRPRWLALGRVQSYVCEKCGKSESYPDKLGVISSFVAAALFPLIPVVGYQLGKYELSLAVKAAVGGFVALGAYAAYNLYNRKKFLGAHPEVKP